MMCEAGSSPRNCAVSRALAVRHQTRQILRTSGIRRLVMSKSLKLLLLLVVSFVAIVFTGCSRDPNVRKQKYLESGQRYYDKGKYREAAIQFQNAIQVDPRFADAHYKLAQAEMKVQQWNAAFEELQKTLELQPENDAAHLDMANLLIAGQHAKEAKEHLDQLLQKNPNNAGAQMALANYYA